MIKLGDSFKAQVGTMVSGTAVAQVISLALMPVLTRLYSPADFGALAIFNSIVALWSLVSTFRLENAIILPKQEAEAEELVGAGFWCNAFSSIFLYFIVKGATFLLADRFPSPCEVADRFALFIALNCFFLGASNLMNQWHNRKADYVVAARRIIVDRAAFIVVAMLFSQLGELGMVAGQSASAALVFLYLFWKALRTLPLVALKPRFDYARVVRSYLPFSVKHGAGTIIQVAAWQIPPLMISSWFPLEAVGKYNLASRLLEAPLYLLGNSFSGVFYRKLSVSEPSQWKNYLARVLRPLILIPPVPILILTLFAPQLFALVFGPYWRESGAFFAALSVLYWWRVIYIACSPLYLVLNRLGADLIFSILLLVTQVGSVYLGVRYFDDLHQTMVLMSLSSSAAVILSVYWIYRWTRERSAAAAASAKV